MVVFDFILGMLDNLAQDGPVERLRNKAEGVTALPGANFMPVGSYWMGNCVVSSL